MKDILLRANAHVLTRLAVQKCLLAFDFDGTLAPIVIDRDRAHMRALTRDLLTQLACRYPCAVISGRSRADVARRVAGTEVAYVVGNHGLESSPATRSAAALHAMRIVRAELARRLGAVPGVDIEDKGLSLAIHYRRARSAAVARRAIGRAVASLTLAVRTLAGKRVLNVLPCNGANKADALVRLKRLARVQTALYVGDDVTDEDAFRSAARADVVAVRVGRSRSSAAPYYVPRQRDIDRLLRLLIDARDA